MFSRKTPFQFFLMFLASLCLLAGHPLSASADGSSFTADFEEFLGGILEDQKGSRQHGPRIPGKPKPPKLKPPKPVKPERLKLGGLAEHALWIVLPALGDDESENGNSELSRGAKRIGIGRALPPPYNKVLNSNKLTWEWVADEGQAAQVVIRSPEASWLRVAFLVYHLPDAVEIRFFSPQVATAPVHLVTGAEINQQVARQRVLRDANAKDPALYWSPSTSGQDLGIEFFFPTGVTPSDMKIALPKISHGSSVLFSGPALDLGVGSSNECELDISCYLNSGAKVSRAVAKLVFTTPSGVSAVCSGTLVADLDKTSQIPYLLTANHCVPNQSVAASVQTYWFFRSQYCNGPPSPKVTALGGGAMLLGTFINPDISLLRLAKMPPAGALMAGWDASPPNLPTAVTGVHHPSGDLQKISFGNSWGLGFCNIDQELGFGSCGGLGDAEGKYYEVYYDYGVVEPGSSGSAIFSGRKDKLIGVLSAGPSEAVCGDYSSFYYSRFDLAFESKFRKWLAVSDACDSEAGNWAYCSNPACGTCAEGQGDCDSDDECQSGLVCTENAGAEFGYDPLADVCTLPPQTVQQLQCQRANGDWDFCSDPACGPCIARQGDCDTDSECIGDLVCRRGVGAEYGLPADVDVCDLLPGAECELTNGDWQYCSDPRCGLCAAGQGDCDSNADCRAGSVCSFNAGAKYGLPDYVDVCEPVADGSCQLEAGDWDYCSNTACGPCEVGLGDCDSDTDCVPGLVCATNVGESYGLPATMDICEAP